MSSNDDSRVRDAGVLALTVSYMGSQFAGSQRQADRRTVQGELERSLSGLYGQTISSVFAGRIDQGVHAAGQVVSFEDRRPDLSLTQIRNAIDARLPDDMSVVRAERRPAGFHARYDAQWREYRYRLWCGQRQPLAVNLVAQRSGRLDQLAMSTEARVLVGKIDLASFAGDGEGVPWSERQDAAHGTVRTVISCSARRVDPWWTEFDDTGDLIEIRVIADGFLPKMVRNIAGALIDVGSGRRPAGWISELLAGRDRRKAGKTAPAQGLILWRVGYEGDVPSEDLARSERIESRS